MNPESPSNSAQAKHTAGPWRVSQNVSHHVVREKGGLIAVCDAGDYSCSREEGEANARLIASAPDLLAALEAIAERPAVPFVRDQLEMANRTIERIEEIARAAIARATGAQP